MTVRARQRRIGASIGDRNQDQDYVLGLLEETREETTRADQKAGVVLFVLGVALGALLAGLIAGDWSPVNLSGLAKWLWWPGAVLLLGSLAAAAVAVWPRFRRARPNRITYWGDAGQTDSPADLMARLESQEVDPITRMVEELWVLSRIVVSKYRFVRIALLLAAVGFAFQGTAALLDFL
ncbi:MAG: Pycsar system effector family protein [Acidimicrobiia bacterium]